VRTTVDLPVELLRAAKVRAAREGRSLKDVLIEAIGAGLASPERPPAAAQRVVGPLVECAHRATPGEEMTPDRAAAVLLGGEAAAQEPS